MVEGIGRVEGARSEPVREHGSAGMTFPKPSCLAGSNPHTKLDLHPFPKAMKPRHDRRRFGAPNHVLFTGFVVKLPGGRGKCEGTHESRDEGVCAQRSSGRNGAARSCLDCDMKRQRSESIRAKARPAHHQARGGSASKRAVLPRNPRLSSSIEATLIEADDGE